MIEAADIPNDESGATSDERWGRLIARLDALAAATSEFDREARPTIERLSSLLARAEAVVAFGGHFSAGKSSVLNAVLGRPLLPVDDLPETGVPCYLRTGEADVATVVGPGGRREMPCDPENLRRQVALWREAGANADLRDVDCVEIALRDAPIPPNACWVDTPGLDSGEESQGAERAADAADLLAWVVKSDQALGESDVAALSRHVAAHGPGSIAILTNSFLADDTADAWERFLASRWPACRTRLKDRRGEIGLPEGFATPELAVSARAAARDPQAFGLPGLLALLAEASGPTSSIIRRSRAGRAAVVLGWHLDSFGVTLRSMRDENRRSVRVRAEEQGEIERRRAGFKAAVAAAVAHFLDAFAAKAAKAAIKLARKVANDEFDEDGSFKKVLSDKLRKKAGKLYDALLDRLDEDAARWKQDRLSGPARKKLKRILEPKDVDVDLPEDSESSSGLAKPAAGAIMGGLIGSLFGPAGTLMGAGLGGALGRGNSSNRTKTKIEETVRAHLVEAADGAVASLGKKRRKAIALICSKCVPKAGVATPPPDDEREARLAGLLAQVADLIAAFSETAGFEARTGARS